MTMATRARAVAQAYQALFAGVTLLLLAAFVAVPGMTAFSPAEGIGSRTALVSAFAGFRFWAGDTVFNQVVVGEEGWLFYTGDFSMRDFQRTRRYKERDLKAFRRNLADLESILAEDGRSLLLVIAPNKSTIYPQYMPDEIAVLGSTSAFDQFTNYVQVPGISSVLDLRPALMREALTQQIYYATDTHWNELGAYYSYVEVLRSLSARHLAWQPRPLSDFEMRTVAGGRATDLPKLMGALPIREDDLILDPRFPVAQTETSEMLPNGLEVSITTNSAEKLPSLLILGDSFSFALEKFLALDSGRVIHVPRGSLTRADLDALIRYTHPDVVIIECAERYLEQLFPLVISGYR